MAAKNKQSIGFIYNGEIISNPYPILRLDEGNFAISNRESKPDMKLVFEDLLKQMD